jgi:hypothetical protein
MRQAQASPAHRDQRAKYLCILHIQRTKNKEESRKKVLSGALVFIALVCF